MKGWATLAELETVLTRVRVLEANELLDAIEEAEAEEYATTKAQTRSR